MWNWIVQYTGGFPVLPLLSIAAGIYLLTANKAFMRKLLAPTVALVVIVFNPILYSLLYANNNLPFVTSYGLRYWRFFWLLPQGILIAAAAVHLMRLFSHPLIRCLGLALASAIIVLAGQNLFLDDKQFKPAVSPYKPAGRLRWSARRCWRTTPNRFACSTVSSAHTRGNTAAVFDSFGDATGFGM